ncbi:hypothetical protein CTAYLR_007042 [Chrysophaeum taylorii]|uniref:peptidylprolyl isomerase n=1 Tax=Chrysophaeum taylorii TaxID=2483200 RepID=A0AAD7U6V7_9STRA|nr:hypothetical protein CTAYLR_007042 [Chrysophaeum taylorii]
MLVVKICSVAALLPSHPPRRRWVTRRGAVVDVSGDGGVVKTWSEGGSGTEVFREDGAVALLKYTATSDGVTLASSSDLAYTVGDVEWVMGFDLAVRSMKVGERAAFECKPDYGYGATGVPPAVAPGAGLALDLEVLDYRGNVLTSQSFAQDKPLTPRTAQEIKDEYERRKAARRDADARRALEELIDDDLFAPIKRAIKTFQGFYFFGFFESATGEQAPWYLRPLITFPAIFLVVGVSTYFLFTNDVILLKGEGPTIPGEEAFRL